MQPCRPPAGQVRVRVRASSVEYTDVLIRRHLYPQTTYRRPPFVLSYGVVGEIDQLGDGVRGFQLGDRVADMTVVGSNAAYRTLRARDLVRVPKSVDAAGGGCADLELDDRLPASTPRGPGAARPARPRAGGRRRSRPGAARARQTGGTRAVGHRARRAWVAHPRARRHTDRLPTRRLHAGPAGRVRRRLRRHWRGRLSPLIRGAQARRPALRLWLLGGRAGATHAHHVDVDRAPVSMELAAGRQARPLYSINAMRARHPAWFREDLERLLGLLATRAIRPRVAERISFEEVAEAHRRLEAGGLEGKLVLCPDESGPSTVQAALRTERAPLRRLLRPACPAGARALDAPRVELGLVMIFLEQHREHVIRFPTSGDGWPSGNGGVAGARSRPLSQQWTQSRR